MLLIIILCISILMSEMKKELPVVLKIYHSSKNYISCFTYGKYFFIIVHFFVKYYPDPIVGRWYFFENYISCTFLKKL
jgi:hypothetical protein